MKAKDLKGVKLSKGKTAYWDPKTKTHLTISNNKEKFTDKQREELDFTNIMSALRSGVLSPITFKEDKKEDSEDETKDTNEEDTNEEDTNEEDTNEEDTNEEDTNEEEDQEENELEKYTEDGNLRCQEVKSDGTQCTYDAKYPEDDPKYCGVHNKS